MRPMERHVTRQRRSPRLGAAALAIALSLAGVSALATPASAAEADLPVRPGWPVTTDLASARPMNVPIEGNTGKTGWSKSSSPVLADLYGDGKKEVVIGSLDGRVYVYRPDGSLVWSRYLDAYTTPAGPINGSVAVGDIDGDGRPEVVAGSDNGWVFAFHADGSLVAGWPQFTGWNADYPANCATAACTGVVAAPTLADLDGDGADEVIVGSYSHKMWVWHGNGSVLPGWPRDVWDGIASGAAVGDLNGDGSPDIVVGSDVANDCANCAPYGHLTRGGLLHAFDISGNELPGWPFATDSFMSSSPVLSDLDGDGHLEVISGGGYFPTDTTTRGHTLWVIGSDGRLRWRFTTRGVLLSSPAVGDINGDGRPEIAIADAGCLNGACPGGMVYLLSSTGSLMWQSEGRTTRVPGGSGAYFGGPVLADVTGDGRADVVAADGNWHVKAWDLSGTIVSDTGTTFALWGTPAVGDLDGDGTNEIVVGSAAGNGTGPDIGTLAGSGKVYAWNTAGRGALLFPQYQSRVVPTARQPVCGTGTGSVKDLPMVQRGGKWYGRASYSTGVADACAAFGQAGDIGVTGDWDGNGTQTLGVFRPSTGTWYLRNAAGGGTADIPEIKFAMPGDQPVVGDWDGDGIDDIGVFRASTGTWYLRESSRGGAVVSVHFGMPGDVGVAGDWNGDGTDTPGIFRSGDWYLINTLQDGAAVQKAQFASPGDRPVVGDWNHDGTDTLGVFRNGTWYITNSLSGGPASSFAFGGPGDAPVSWNW